MTKVALEDVVVGPQHIDEVSDADGPLQFATGAPLPRIVEQALMVASLWYTSTSVEPPQAPTVAITAVVA